MFMKQLSDLFFLFVDAGQHNVAGWFVSQLDDTFSQVRINYLHASMFQKFVKLAFFRKHGFTFDNPLYIMLLKDLIYDLIMLGCVGCPMNSDAVFFCAAFKLQEIIVKIG
jgi:hypothetical protein